MASEFSVQRAPVPLEVNGNDNFRYIQTSGRFNILLILFGMLKLRVNGNVFVFRGPAVVCLSHLDTVEKLHSYRLNGKSAAFNPTFINRNMTLDRVTNDNYTALVKQYDFFSLRPFLHHPDECRCLPLSGPLLDSAVRLFERMEAELLEPQDNLWACRIRSFLIRLLTIIEESYESLYENTQSRNEIDPSPIDRVLEYMRAHYTEPVPIPELCRVSGMGKTSLCHRLKQETGMTISDYLIEYRLQAAKKALRFTSLSIHEIAKESGFKYQTYFTRVFVSRCGLSPEKFRKNEVEKRIRDFQRV